MKFDEALSYGMDLCSRQERCRSEVAEKLGARKISPENIEKILDSLQKEKFIDENRYANAFTSDKLKFNKWGKMKIRMMLVRKQIPEREIENAFSQIDEEFYRQILREELSKKRRTIKGSNTFEIRGKLFRFATQRGFEPGYIHSLLDEVI